MGYNMRQSAASFKVKKENKAAVVKALQEMPDDDYAYMDGSDWRDLNNIPDILGEWGWNVKMEQTKTVENGDEIIRTGDVIGISFAGESIGDEHKMFQAIAPFVEPGSFIEMTGEDGSTWRWIFDGSTCEQKSPSIEWK